MTKACDYRGPATNPGRGQREVAMRFALALIIVLLPAIAVAQPTQGGRCIPDEVHYYTFTTAPDTFQDGEFTLYYSSHEGFFLVLLFKGDDVAGGSYGMNRFVHLSLGLLPDTTYDLMVGCYETSAAFRFKTSIVGVEEITRLGTFDALGGEYSASEQLRRLDREATFRRWLASAMQ